MTDLFTYVLAALAVIGSASVFTFCFDMLKPESSDASLKQHAPPELSCLVKGIIASMRDMPGDWKSQGYSILDHGFTHESTRCQVGLCGYRDDSPLYIHMTGVTFTDHEKKAIETAYRIYLRQPLVDMETKMMRRAEEIAKAEAKLNAAIFERLGCPTTPADNASS